MVQRDAIEVPFKHTRYCLYLSIIAAGLSIFHDSSETLVTRYHLNKKWFYLYGVTSLFTYLYTRPFIRRSLGSASQGYINWTAVYIIWLLTAVLYHTPSLDALGIDIKADVSLLLSIFLGTFVVLAFFRVGYEMALAFKIIRPSLVETRKASSKQLWAAVLLNACAIAVACSTYYSFCGNTAAEHDGFNYNLNLNASGGGAKGGGGGIFSGWGMKQLVCDDWLQPVTAGEHPTFSSLVIYEQQQMNVTGTEEVCPSLSSSPVDEASACSLPSPSSSSSTTTAAVPTPTMAISPVLTMWLTIVFMFGATFLAEEAAAITIKYAGTRRTSKSGSVGRRRSSAVGKGDHGRIGESGNSRSSRARKAGGLTRSASLSDRHDHHRYPYNRNGHSHHARQRSVDDELLFLNRTHERLSAFSSMSSLFIPSLQYYRGRNSTSCSAGGEDGSGKREEGGEKDYKERTTTDQGGREQHGLLVNRPSIDALFKKVASVSQFKGLKSVASALFRDDASIGLSAEAPNTPDNTDEPATKGGGSSAANKKMKPIAVTTMYVPEDSPAPNFLPMFPWYSGTSADLLKTMFDLVISVKLFLGRFDMRQMLAATSTTFSGNDANDATGEGRCRCPRHHQNCNLTTTNQHQSSSSPSDGDGFVFEHLADKDELWFDFTADTGDGGDSTYAIARCLAAQSIKLEDGTELPRGEMFIHGGDIAYPNPTDETYTLRFFSPYEAAFPPPPHVHPGQLVVKKPDLPLGGNNSGNSNDKETISSGRNSNSYSSSTPGTNNYCQRCSKIEAMKSYKGPSAFVIPGNHDWVDGLETYQKHILHRGWLGGWLMPQERSYFALHLPHGWWLFGLDLALTDDLDMTQYQYFAKIAEERMGEGDRALLLTHCPRWLNDWFWGTNLAKNLRQLVRGPLKGRARVHLAGDLHFYMRHQYTRYNKNGDNDSTSGNGLMSAFGSMGAMAGLGGGSPGYGSSPEGPSPIGTPIRTFSFGDYNGTGGGGGGGGGKVPGKNNSMKSSSRSSSLKRMMVTSDGVEGESSAVPSPSLFPGQTNPKQLHTSLVSKLNRLTISSNIGVGSGEEKNGLESSTTDDEASWFVNEVSTSSLTNNSSHKEKQQQQQQQSSHQKTVVRQQLKYHLNDPEHLIVCGSGGAFLHPTHIFSSSRIRPRNDPAAGPIGVVAIQQSDKERDGDGATAPLTITNNNTNTPLHDIDCVTRTTSIDKDDDDGWGGGGVGTTSAIPNGGTAECSELSGRTPPTTIMGKSNSRPSAASLHALSNVGSGDYMLGGGPAGASPTYSLSGMGLMSGGGGDDPMMMGGGGGVGVENEVMMMNTNNSGGIRRNPDTIVAGEYQCAASYPPPATSLKLGRLNLHMFRNVNSRFDIIGGALYFLLVCSVLPRCSGVAEILEAQSIGEALSLFFAAAGNTMVYIIAESKLSLAAMAFVFLILFGLGKSGGIGAVNGAPPFAIATRPEYNYKGSTLAVRARLGGVATQITFALFHLAAHLSSAVALILLLELGVETVVKYEQVGSRGYFSLYKWYHDWEEQTFPDPAGVRVLLSNITLGLYPNVIKWVMALFDVPEQIAVTRKIMCSSSSGSININGSSSDLSRLQAIAYYTGMLAYYWLLATPAVAAVFGSYLYICVNWLHVMYDEAASSIQVADYKALLKLHITKDGDLEIFALGIDKVPRTWREDPKWRSSQGGGRGLGGGEREEGGLGGSGNNNGDHHHEVKYPSRFVPVGQRVRYGIGGRRYLPVEKVPEEQLKLVDYLKVAKDEE